MCEILSLSVI